MSLPIVTLDNDEKWSCHQCGICCRGSLVPLSDADIERLRSQKWEEQPEYRNTRLMVRNRGSSIPYRLAHRSDGSCVFLNDDGLCRIHSKFGIEAKPTICQTFPLQLIPHEKQAVLTLRRACPSAAADLGSPMSAHLPFVKQLVRDQRLQAEAIAPPLLKPGEKRNWKTVRSVLESAGGLLRDQRYPPVRRLVHALQFAGLLAQAKTRDLSDQQIVELARTLAELAPEESVPFFAERRSPRGYAKTMFRLMAIDCARLHPQCRHRSTWSARFQLVRTAWRVARGSGRTPSIDQVFTRADFDELEEASGPLSPEIYVPLARFIEATSASFLYAIADRRGWSVVDSIRGLALLFPVGLWLLRWRAQGRQPTVEDMLQIIVALDRSQGYAPHCGLVHRLRLSTLAAGGELERLVAWYAR
jgi:lysine-N-methylase